MRKKINWKILFSLVGFIALWSCQDDNISKNHNHSHDHNTKDLVFKTVNLSDIPNLKNSLNNLKNEIPLSGINYRTIENQSNYFDLIVPYNVNSFIYDKSNNLHHYTFALNIEETNTKTNLVAKETLSGEFEYYVFVFKPDDYQEWYNAIKNSDTSYNKSIDFEAFEIGQPQNTTYSMCLETTEVWTCPWGIHTLGEPGWGDCDSFKPGGGGINSWVRSYTYQMVSCGGLGGGGSTPVNPSDPNNPSNPNPGAGNGNGAGAIPNLTSPEPCIMNNSSVSFIDLLNDAQKAWWNDPENSVERNKIDNFLKENSCSQGDLEIAKDFLDITEEIDDAKFERYLELLDLIEDNPWALIEDCAQQNGMNTADYSSLYFHTIPQACKNRLNSLGSGYKNQPISEGNVPCANMDYYGVEITTRPDFNNDGQPDTNAQIYQAFRNNFTNLASGEKENFQFSCNIPGNSTNTGDVSWEFIPLTSYDGTLFISNNPITAILDIEADATGFFPTIAADDGAIMVSGFTPNNWTISTIETPHNGSQPFSGNRQWGWFINQNGNIEIFTKAVDVAKISKLLNIGANTQCQQETYYDIAEATWENLQQEIANWVNSPNYGGQAIVKPKTAVRIKKEHIIILLTSTQTINQIPSICD